MDLFYVCAAFIACHVYPRKMIQCFLVCICESSGWKNYSI